MRPIYSSCMTLFFLLSACHRASNDDKKPDVNVIEPKKILAPLNREYIGSLKSIRNVTLRARVEGFLNQRLFKEGDVVHQDDILYVIDKAPFQAQLQIAEGNLLKAKADLAYQEVQLRRYEQLVKHQNVSKSNYDQQLSAYKAAQGNLESAEGNYQQAKLNLSYCDVFSPLNGLTGKSYVDLGNLVSAANKTELVNIVQLDPLRVEFNPSINDMSLFVKYRANKPFKTVVKMPQVKEKTWHGIVDFYDNSVNISTSTLLLRTTIRNTDLFLRPDVYVNVQVTLDPKHQFTLIPINRMLEVQGVRQVEVVNKDKKLVWRSISIGEVHDKWIEVMDGLEDNDLIVDQDFLRLQEGTIVNPILTQTTTNNKQA